MFIGIVGRLAWINIVDGEVLREVVAADKKYTKNLEAERGDILDRNGVVMAYTQTVHKITINRDGYKNDNFEVRTIVNETIDKLIEKIAPIMDMSESEIEELLEVSESKYVVIGYVDDKDVARQLKLVPFDELWVNALDERKYPLGSSAAEVLGLTKRAEDGVGVEGIYGVEKVMEVDLNGIDGIFSTEVDNNRNQLHGVKPMYIPEMDGDDVYLTIDNVIQQSVEDAIKKGYEEWSPVAVHAIVLDVRNGEVISMASYPTYDPEKRELIGYSEEYLSTLTSAEQNQLFSNTLTNDNVTSAYELGSTIKLVTTAIALEEDLYTKSSVFDEGNITNVTGVPIKCWYYPSSHGVQTLVEAVENSCNPVFVEIGRTIGQDTLLDYFAKFGLNDPVKLNLPRMVKPVNFNLETIVPVDLATMTFGHGEKYSPLHVANALAALVNGGDLLEPKIIKTIINERNEIEYEAEKTIVRNVISDITSQQMREIMESVVVNGSGQKAQIDGIRIGGKTGTAEKIVDGEYSSTVGVASFVGVLPINNPEYLVYIVVDEPKGSMLGSQVAAPIARDVMLSIVDYKEYQRSYVEALEIMSVPNLEGLTLEDATELVESLNLEIRVTTQGDHDDESLVISQYPRPGTERPAGSAILVEISQ